MRDAMHPTAELGPAGRTKARPFAAHASRDAGNIGNKFTAQPERVGLTSLLLFRRSLRLGGRRDEARGADQTKNSSQRCKGT